MVYSEQIRNPKVLYKEALEYIKIHQNDLRDTGKFQFDNLFELSEGIVRNIDESTDLSSLAVHYFDINDLTISHAVNVTIFSAVLAKGLKYSTDEQIRLCAAALIHDIGSAKVPLEILEKDERKLTQHEIWKFRSHSALGAEAILNSEPSQSYLAKVIYQHHEKDNGHGYPDRLLEDDLLPDARVISMIDAYEALIHPRSHRDALVPPVGIKQIISQKGSFYSTHLVKALIEYISIYPVGLYVQLNSGEIGKVNKTRKENPLRPEVKLIFDAQRNPIKNQYIDLNENYLETIERSIPLTNVQDLLA